ncbi:MAG: hypothetical protein RL748_3167 [Pseudomonadota bacterium]|jgi:uncharacterized protein YfaT (DUF1175 family)
MMRRGLLRSALAWPLLMSAPFGVLAAPGASTILPPAQSRLFRAWMVRIISAQFQSGPTPRWQQRDCVGLVRFAVAEALREHDAKWKQANSLAGQTLPPEIQLNLAQQALRHNWRRADGSKSAYVSALELVQENTRFVGKDCNAAQPGDLLFFDQGDAQHLMVWMGRFIAYHTGSVEKQDNGLRTLELRQLLRWPDTRWHPAPDNPNFAGVYKLQFLSA